MQKAIEVSHLKKSYGEIKAVNDISFYVECGKLFSFLGPNGAGKSTTIDILCTLLKADAGEVKVDGMLVGRDDAKIRRSIGVVFQNSVLDPLLTVRENLFIRASFYTKNKNEAKATVEAAAAAAEIVELINRPFGKLSGGQRRRADIARAFLNTPKILFLDEPTTGLDPQTRKSVWETIRQLQGKTGMTVFLTTHYMEEAADSDYVIVIDNGVISAKGTPGELKEQYAHDILRLYAKDETQLAAALERLSIDCRSAGRQYIITLPSTLAALPVLQECSPYIDGFEVLGGTMDDAFIGITGKEIRE